jgi:histidinol phosphatase-like enzyme (inositol monophosphatase family)
MHELNELRQFCKKLADESGKIIKHYWRSGISIESKSDSSPVTIADKKAEEFMREMIMKKFPNHGILGEEFGEHNSHAIYKWVLDPIDGTKSFICGTVTFGTLIALLKNGEPILGVINQPILNEYLIGDNRTTELNGKEVHVKNCEKISEAVLLTTDQLNVEQYQNIKNFDNLVHKVKLYRQWGDCYGYYLVATGYANIMIDPIMSPWDSLALIPIIKGAGGTITDYQGGDPVKGKSIVATGGTIHSEVIKLISGE